MAIAVFGDAIRAAPMRLFVCAKSGAYQGQSPLPNAKRWTLRRDGDCGFWRRDTSSSDATFRLRQIRGVLGTVATKIAIGNHPTIPRFLRDRKEISTSRIVD
jgi:hypothetical protein